MPVLTVHNALVRSAAVEIRTLTVSGKQVTQAVFRQVPEQEILRADGSLAGVPWGWVNYWWRDTEPWGEKPLHVLWQQGGELRRAIVPEPSAYAVRICHTRWNPDLRGRPLVAALAHLDKQVHDLWQNTAGRRQWDLPPFHSLRPEYGVWEVASLDEVPEDAHRLARAAQVLVERWRASYDTCHAAGQLFIAC
jgi:hypothetical protein